MGAESASRFERGRWRGRAAAVLPHFVALYVIYHVVGILVGSVPAPGDAPVPGEPDPRIARAQAGLDQSSALTPHQQAMPELEIFAVSRAVNSPRNDRPELLDPAEEGR